MNNVQRNYGVDRKTAYEKLKLNKFNEDLSRTKIKKTKLEDDNINRWLYSDYLDEMDAQGINTEKVFRQLKLNNFNKVKSRKNWNHGWA